MTRTLLVCCSLGCTVGDGSSDDNSVTDGGTTSDPDPGGLAVLSGLDAHELAFVVGPGESCGRDPSFVVGDPTGDGVSEVALVCRNPTDTDDRDLFVLDGAALVTSTLTQIAVVRAGRSTVSAVGDLDGDGLEEIGLDTSEGAVSGQELGLWNVRPGTTLVGDTAGPDGAFTMFGEGSEYGSEAMLAAGDLDLDGALDVAVWQYPGSQDPVLSLVSGATLMSGAHTSAVTGALRRVEGLGREEQPADLANIGDLDADGETDLATVIVDSVEQTGVENPIAVTVFTASSLVEPSTTMRTEMAEPGRSRRGQVEALGDLDGDGRVELAALLSSPSSQDNHTEIVVIPGAVLAAGADVASAPYALGGGPFASPQQLDVCDLDGDGLLEIVSDAGIWDGRDLLTPGTVPVGPGVSYANCAGDLDGVLGSELVQGRPITGAYWHN